MKDQQLKIKEKIESIPIWKNAIEILFSGNFWNYQTIHMLSVRNPLIILSRYQMNMLMNGIYIGSHSNWGVWWTIQSMTWSIWCWQDAITLHCWLWIRGWSLQLKRQEWIQLSIFGCILVLHLNSWM